MLLIPVLALSLFSVPASAEQLITRIVLNQEEKGDLFVDRSENGDFLLKTEDLKSIGFRSTPGKAVQIRGEEYRSLNSMDGVKFAFDEGALSLAITADPSLLGKEIIDFFSKQMQKVYYPQDSSVFLNYGADYLAGDGFSFSSFNLTNQLGARKGSVLFLSDSIFTKDQNQERIVRLQSSLTYDDRKALLRFVAGDFFASSGELGSSLNLGGISFAKIYRLDPYFISYPTLGLAGQVALPSEAKIYLNGMLMKTEKFSPGEFELKNITPYGTAGAIEVVLKDPFGREQRLNYPFYFGGSNLLKRGLQEYSYNLGFIREQFGTDSNRYSDPAFSAFHRYGISNSLTLGYRMEATNSLYNLGPQATYLLGNAGLFNLSLAGSTGRSSNTGAAGTGSYAYQGLHAGANFSVSRFTRDYTIIARNQAIVPKTTAVASLTYTDRLLGSLSVAYSSTRMYLGEDSDVASVSYYRNLTGECSINATYRNVKETNSANEFYIALNYTPKPDLFLSASYQTAKENRNSVLEVQKNPPTGEGLGYRVILNRSVAAGEAISTANPSLQYNGRYGIYQGEFNAQENSGHLTGQYHLSASGALVYLGNTFGAMRPVYDSFGLVKVGNLEGIKVLVNSQEIGATDSSGKLFIPNLGSFYQSQVAINDKQIPIEYFLSDVVKIVSPPFRSGSCIPFVAKKMQPITGILKMRIGGELKPLEFQEISLNISGKEIAFPTGTGGVFDLDLSQAEEFKKLTDAEESGCASLLNGPAPFIKPGIYQAAVQYEGRRYAFGLTVPDSRDPIIDLGPVIVNAPPEAGKAPAVKTVPGRLTSEVKAPTSPEKAPAPSATPPGDSQGAPSAAQPVSGVAAKAAEKGSEPVPVKTRVPQSTLSTGEIPVMEVNFRFGTADFSSKDDRAVLMTVDRLMELLPDPRLVVAGYTDQIGSRRYNRLLSKRRALTVAAGLKKLGVSDDKFLSIEWFGKRHPKCFSLDESCREQNRRAVIKIVTGH